MTDKELFEKVTGKITQAIADIEAEYGVDSFYTAQILFSLSGSLIHSHTGDEGLEEELSNMFEFVSSQNPGD